MHRCGCCYMCELSLEIHFRNSSPYFLFFKYLFLFWCVCMFSLCVCLSTMLAPRACGGQQKCELPWGAGKHAGGLWEPAIPRLWHHRLVCCGF